MAAVARPGPIYRRITQKITDALRPSTLKLIDESPLHAGHAESSGLPETHFKLHVVSTEFDGMTVVQRHRTVYKILADELSEGVHALSLSTKTPSEAQM